MRDDDSSVSTGVRAREEEVKEDNKRPEGGLLALIRERARHYGHSGIKGQSALSVNFDVQSVPSVD